MKKRNISVYLLSLLFLIFASSDSFARGGQRIITKVKTKDFIN